MHKVSVNRIYVLRSIILATLMMWPLLLFGKPAYMVDSSAYQNGGERAVAFVAHKLDIPIGIADKPGTGPSSEAALKNADGSEDAKVARAITYSVIAYVLSGPGLMMAYLALFHALSTGLVATALFEAIAGPTKRGFTVLAGVLTFGTGLPLFVNFMIPDIFAGLLLGAMMILPFYWQRCSWPILVLVTGCVALSVSFHASLPPLALGTALVITIFMLLLKKNRPSHPVQALALLWAPVVLGIGLTMLTGVVGFGQPSIAPKHYPLALARGLDNGPARWYLNDVCKDRSRYAMCEIYGTNMPVTVDEFLWSKHNIVTRATPEQMDRIRAEEKPILIRSTMHYPFEQARLILQDVPDQFFSFRLNFFRYGATIVRKDDGNIILKGAGTGDVPEILTWLDWVADAAILIATLALALWWRTMSLAERGIILTLIAGLLVNAAVCAIFSGVAARYQARIIWLIPFTALAIACARGHFGAAVSTLRERRS